MRVRVLGDLEVVVGEAPGDAGPSTSAVRSRAPCSLC